MDMNGVERTGGPESRPPIEPQQQEKAMLDKAGRKPRKQGDRVDLSDEAKKLVADKATADAVRKAKIESARKRLESGELFRPEAIENAAKNLLKSGTLKKSDDE